MALVLINFMLNLFCYYAIKFKYTYSKSLHWQNFIFFPQKIAKFVDENYDVISRIFEGDYFFPTQVCL